jgi:sugar lactone lactonase YvrE
VILLADSFSGLIWHVDLNLPAGTPKASAWLRHDSMGHFPGQMKPEQPGANGVQYSPKRGCLHYTATARALFMRVKVEPNTFDPIGEPEVVGGGRMFDDFRIDQDAGVAYLTTHRQNTIDRFSLEPGENGKASISIAGDPFTPELIGPSAGHWERGPANMGVLPSSPATEAQRRRRRVALSQLSS